ncbi:MAG: hypothetical protein QXS54_03290 [Candidatus Methanomethylicaceae archaeon]
MLKQQNESVIKGTLLPKQFNDEAVNLAKTPRPAMDALCRKPIKQELTYNLALGDKA